MSDHTEVVTDLTAASYSTGALEFQGDLPKESPYAQEYARRTARLTRRERDVLELLIEGLQNKVIARKLGISPRTVEVYRARVMEKTQAENLIQLVRLAVRAGF